MTGWVSFSEVKNRAPLELVLRWYGVDWLRRSGTGQYRGRCPIHQGEGKDAFHANYDRNVFHCFACGVGGNVLDFVAAMEKSTIREAAMRLACFRTVTARVTSAVAERKLVTKKRSSNPCLPFSLSVDRRHPYLKHRGLDDHTVDYFGVGFYGRGGLMSGRIAIPIHDAASQLVAYCGRSIDGAEPRYRFPAEFQKSLVLFNYHRARATAERALILVEGFFDCMRVHQAGFPAVAALMGAKLSCAQKELLTKRFARVILMLDGDETGRAATDHITEQLRGTCPVDQVRLPAGVQPDQLPAERIRQLLHRGNPERRRDFRDD